MNELELKQFKKEIKPFYNLIKKLINDNKWDNKSYTCAEVLLQNISFIGAECESYEHSKEAELVKRKIDCLKALSEYYESDWFLSMIYKEVDMIYAMVFFDNDIW